MVSLRVQPIVTMSTYESKYVSPTCCACHATWLRKLLKELFLEKLEATKIMIDNKLDQELDRDPVFHEESKHIDARFHLI